MRVWKLSFGLTGEGGTAVIWLSVGLPFTQGTKGEASACLPAQQSATRSGRLSRVAEQRTLEAES